MEVQWRGFCFASALPQQLNQRVRSLIHSMKQEHAKQVILDGEGFGEAVQRSKGNLTGGDQVRDGRPILQATARKAPLSGGATASRGWWEGEGERRGGTRDKRQETETGEK